MYMLGNTSAGETKLTARTIVGVSSRVEAVCVCIAPAFRRSLVLIIFDSGADRPVSTQTPAQKAPETLTKRQRQNASKREVQKAAKAEGEAARLATLAKHKREAEQARMAEQFRGKGSTGKMASGGMKATVDERGKLVWE